MKDYQRIRSGDQKDIVDVLNIIIRERKNDITDFNNLKNIFISGRKVARIPTGASNVISGDRVGDFNYTSSYIYICTDNSGTPEWRRVALSTW